MKNLILIFLIFFYMDSLSQNIFQKEISSASNHFSDSKINYSYTLGGVFVQTLANGQNLTQGFHQPELINFEKDTDVKNYKLQVYPNPVKEILFVRFEKENLQTIGIEIVDINGKTIRKQIIESSIAESIKTIKLNLSDFVAGFYIISLSDSQNKRFLSFKIQKE